MDTLGKRLQFWRESEKLSIYDLAKMTNIKAEDLYLIETDQSQHTWDILNNLIIYTQIDFRWLLLGSAEPVSTHLVYDK